MAEKYFPGTGILTKDALSSGERRNPIRPLGSLSDLVVDGLPAALALAKVGDLTQARELLDKAEEYAGDFQDIGLPQEGTLEHQVGRLDVLMLYVGFAHSGFRINPNLSNLVGEFSRVKIPALTYEDIVLNNPKGDPRTFTDQEVGADEEHFYLIHQELEHAMKPAVLALKDAIFTHIKSRDNFTPTDALQKKATADVELAALDLLVDNTRTVGKGMRYFDEFRPFLNPIPKEYLAPTLPQQEYAGPSGAYSGTVHSLDLLIEGSAGNLAPDNEVISYLEVNRQYIPQVEYILLDEAIAFATREKGFLHIRDEEDKMLIDTLAEYGSRLLMFRRIHLGSVRRQVPAVIRNDSEVGTGGISNVARFLQSRIDRTEATLKLFEETRKELDNKKIRHYF